MLGPVVASHSLYVETLVSGCDVLQPETSARIVCPSPWAIRMIGSLVSRDVLETARSAMLAD